MQVSQSQSVRPFRFESYGVTVEITGNEQDMVDRGEATARISMLGNLRIIDTEQNRKADHNFELNKTKGGTYQLIQNGKRLGSGRSQKKFFKFFDSIVRVAIGEYAVDRVFLHAGVVGWNGKAIILPADSFQGKSTLVTELVRLGATYYSDEYAICDKDGLVHPFHRPIARRTEGKNVRTFELSVEELGGTYGMEPIPVGTIIFTGYREGQKWEPKTLSHGNGVLELIPFTLPIRFKPDFSIQVLNKISQHAIIATGHRGTAEKFAKTLLDFVDKNVD